MRYPYTIFILTHRQQQHCRADSFSSKFTSIKTYELALFTPEFTVGRNQPDTYLKHDIQVAETAQDDGWRWRFQRPRSWDVMCSKISAPMLPELNMWTIHFSASSRQRRSIMTCFPAWSWFFRRPSASLKEN